MLIFPFLINKKTQLYFSRTNLILSDTQISEMPFWNSLMLQRVSFRGNVFALNYVPTDSDFKNHQIPAFNSHRLLLSLASAWLSIRSIRGAQLEIDNKEVQKVYKK